MKTHVGRAGFMSHAACGSHRSGMRIMPIQRHAEVTCARCLAFVRRKLVAMRPPRNVVALIREVTNLSYCDRDCPCGVANGLWWFPTPRPSGRVNLSRDRVHTRDWAPRYVEQFRPLPGWMNGATTADIWRWLVEHNHPAAFRVARREKIL